VTVLKNQEEKELHLPNVSAVEARVRAFALKRFDARAWRSAMERKELPRRYLTVKLLLIAVSMGLAVLLMATSCATVSTTPLAPGEVRLVGINIPEIGDLRANLQYPVNIRFEADGRPDITRACFSWSGDGSYCFKVVEMDYGSRTIEVDFRSPDDPGSYTLESYVLYVRDGRTTSTNVVRTHVYVIKK
jgi:hypothetical protein